MRAGVLLSGILLLGVCGSVYGIVFPVGGFWDHVMASGIVLSILLIIGGLIIPDKDEWLSEEDKKERWRDE